jgi:acyl dehydratase
MATVSVRYTIGLALAQVSRALPNIVTVVGGDGCDHLGPVHEGESLTSVITAESTQPLPAGGGLAWLRIDVTARAGHPPRAAVALRRAPGLTLGADSEGNHKSRD